MNISRLFDELHSRVKKNSWLWLFSIFNRVSLAFGFFVAGMVKVLGERFASGLSANHPMGHFLEALHKTGYYYTFIGIAQIAAAIMILIPRTVTLGAFIYFPIILNICILTYATRFDGSMFTAPLMTLANLFLLGWNYEKWKYILPFNQLSNKTSNPESDIQAQESAEPLGNFSRDGIRSFYIRFRNFLKQLSNDKFPMLFFAGVFAVVVICAIGIPGLYSVVPHNTLPGCLKQFKDSSKTKAGEVFCSCIHQNGEPLDKCLLEFNSEPADNIETH